MTFLWPGMFLFLLLIPLCALWYARVQQRRQAMLARYSGLEFMQGAAQGGAGVRRHVPPALFLIALTILIFALARPQTVISLPRIAGTVILAFDVSGSMAADDIEPTRMDAAKLAVESFVQSQPSTVQIGVVAFSDSGLSVQAPTDDQGEVLGAIARLSPQRGTSLANGIIASLDAIAKAGEDDTHYYSNLTPTPAPSPTPVPKGTYTPGVIILLTDGENNERPDPLAAAQAATDRGVRIYTVGIGSAAGTDLHVDGFTVHTVLDEAMLQQISTMTGGEYYNAETEEDLLNIYGGLSTQLVIRPEETEVTPLFAGAGILVLLVGGLLSLLWFGRVP